MAENIGDNQALFLHYKNMHPDATTQDLELSQAFRVIFIEKPPVDMLDVREDFWISRLNASINIKKSILPRYKSSFPNAWPFWSFQNRACSCATPWLFLSRVQNYFPRLFLHLASNFFLVRHHFAEDGLLNQKRSAKFDTCGISFSVQTELSFTFLNIFMI